MTKTLRVTTARVGSAASSQSRATTRFISGSTLSGPESLHPATTSSSCQDRVATRGSSQTGSILLLHFEPPHREELELSLRARRHYVLVPETNGRSLPELKREMERAAFVIFDLSHVNHDVWRELRDICRLRNQDGMPVMVTCWSRVYRGPEFHFLVEKLGARLVYAK